MDRSRLNTASVRTGGGSESGHGVLLFRLLELLILSLIPIGAFCDPPVETIVQRSVEVVNQDWRAVPDYDYFERDLQNGASKTYRVTIIMGSPFRQIEAIDGMPLAPEEKQEERKELQDAIMRRCGESKPQREQRIQSYRKSLAHDHRLIEALTNAFLFHVAGQETVEGRATWLLQATPRPGYQPANKETKVLTGMQGELWIDKATFEWVQAKAWVVHPVSIEGFLARVEPGTEFELVRAPVPGGAWMPVSFSVRSKSRILSFFVHHTREEETYFNYRGPDSAKAVSCPSSLSGEAAAISSNRP